MTRLIEDWIKDISTSMKEYERDLLSKTGLDFLALACAAGEISKEQMVAASKKNKVGVIPITAGLGIIGSFSQSVAAIVQHMNFGAFITDCTDVAGIYEAYQRGAQILFMADEERFIAVNLKKGTVADNNRATAKGYVAALEGAAGKLKGREVLVLGCGPVGREALLALRLKGANPVAYDINESILTDLAKEGFGILSDPAEIVEYQLIIDANPQGGWINRDMLHPEVWFAAPGVPLSLDAKAYAAHKDRVIHDYLPIGVAAMLGAAL